MNIKNIKTETQFTELAEIWYERVKSLFSIYQNEEETIKRRFKAYMLWTIMVNRTIALTQIYVEISKPKPLNKIKSDKIAIAGERINDETSFMPMRNELILLPNISIK